LGTKIKVFTNNYNVPNEIQIKLESKTEKAFLLSFHKLGEAGWLN
jgi:hypothetical protein